MELNLCFILSVAVIALSDERVENKLLDHEIYTPPYIDS